MTNEPVANESKPKILIKAPDIRDPDGKIRVPVVPALAGFIAFFAATAIKMRENQAKMAQKQADAAADAE